MSEEITDLAQMPGMATAQIDPVHALSAVALSMAMKYHEIGVIKDGAMYQQLKLEGANIRSLGLEDVLETAKRLEVHLMQSSERLAGPILDMLVEELRVDKNDNGENV